MYSVFFFSLRPKDLISYRFNFIRLGTEQSSFGYNPYHYNAQMVQEISRRYFGAYGASDWIGLFM